MVEAACASQGITSLHLKKDVLRNKMPACYLAKAKDVLHTEHASYAALSHPLVQRLMPEWESSMQTITGDKLGGRRPSDMLRDWAAIIDVVKEERHLKTNS